MRALPDLSFVVMVMFNEHSALCDGDQFGSESTIEWCSVRVEIVFHRPAHCPVSQAASRNPTNPTATSHSAHLPAARPPLACALICTPSYCLFSRCISGRVTLRIGRWRNNGPRTGAGGEGIGKVEADGEALMWDKREVVMVLVVVVRVFKVFGGGLGRCGTSARAGGMRDGRTTTTAEVGGALAPVVMVFQIVSNGGASSHGIVKSGESQRTMDEGSSNRMIRFSKLLDHQGYTRKRATRHTSHACTSTLLASRAIPDICPEESRYGSFKLSSCSAAYRRSGKR